MSEEYLSSGFPRKSHGVPFGKFGMLPAMPRKKSPAKRKAKAKRKPTTDFQKFLAGLIDETGLTPLQFEALSAEMGRRVPASTLSTTLNISDNPGIKTIEGIALALGKPPLAIMAKSLDAPPEEQMEGFELSLVATVWNYYKVLTDQDRAYFDLYVLKPMIENMVERISQGAA